MKEQKLLSDLVDHLAEMIGYCGALEARIPEAELQALRSNHLRREASSASVRLVVKDSRGH